MRILNFNKNIYDKHKIYIMKAYLKPKIHCIFYEDIHLICNTTPKVHNKHSNERQLSLPDFLPTTIDNIDEEKED